MTDHERAEKLTTLLRDLIAAIRSAPLTINPGGAVMLAVDDAEQKLDALTAPQ